MGKGRNSYNEEWILKSNEELESEYFRAYCDFRVFGKNDWEVSFGLNSPGGGTIGEMTMKWINLDGRKVPQLQVFDDAFKVLSCFGDLMSALAEQDSNNITIDEFVEILKEHNFLDTQSWKGDYIPEKTFELYQKQRQRTNKIKQLV